MTVILGISAPFTLRHVFLLFQLAFGILRRALREGNAAIYLAVQAAHMLASDTFYYCTAASKKKKKKKVERKEKQKASIVRALLATGKCLSTCPHTTSE